MFFARHRPARTLTQLFKLRNERDAQLAEKRRVFGQRALARVKARYDADPGKPVVWNLVVISGGGDWGAFGAGFIFRPIGAVVIGYYATGSAGGRRCC